MTTQKQKALELALEALENLINQHYADTTTNDDLEKADNAITAIKEALMSFQDGAQQSPQRSEDHSNEQVEPVAWCVINNGELIEATLYRDYAEEILAGQIEGCGSEIAPLYTHPPVPTAKPKGDGIDEAAFLERFQQNLDRGRNMPCQTCESLARTVMMDQFSTDSPQLKEPAVAEQHKQEPVATVAEVHISRYTIEWTNGPLPEGTKLYTTPPQRTWVGLTDEQIDAAIRNSKKVDTGYAGWVRDQRREFARAIEAKFKEKNTRNRGCL